MASTILVVAVCALFAYWTVRADDGMRRLHEGPVVRHQRARFIPVGTTRIFTLPGQGPRWSQHRRVRRTVEEHRARGWVLVHDPRPPAYGPDGWLLTFEKVR